MLKTKMNHNLLYQGICFISLILLVVSMTACNKEKSKVEKINKPAEAVKTEKTTPEQPAKDIVVMHTNYGDIKMELFRDKAPITVENFLTYAKEKFYDGPIFHRVISNFMIQGGGFNRNYMQKQPTHPPIKNEATNGLSNVRGTIAMARTNQINSATSQFFINVKDNLLLDHRDMGAGFGYAVFGKVIEDMDIVDKIKNVQTGVNPKTRMKNWPKEDVIINSIEVVE